MTTDGPVVQMLDDRYRGRHIGLDYSGLVEGASKGGHPRQRPQSAYADALVRHPLGRDELLHAGLPLL